MANKTQDYPYIRAYNRSMGSQEYYIQDRVDEARREHAPADAVRRNDDGTWFTSVDVHYPELRARLGMSSLPPELARLANAAYAARDARSDLCSFMSVLPAERVDWEPPQSFGRLTLNTTHLANDLQAFADWAHATVQAYLERERDGVSAR